jgi:hypothetical protein
LLALPAAAPNPSGHPLDRTVVAALGIAAVAVGTPQLDRVDGRARRAAGGQADKPADTAASRIHALFLHRNVNSQSRYGPGDTTCRHQGSFCSNVSLSRG